MRTQYLNLSVVMYRLFNTWS